MTTVNDTLADRTDRLVARLKETGVAPLDWEDRSTAKTFRWEAKGEGVTYRITYKTQVGEYWVRYDTSPAYEDDVRAYFVDAAMAEDLDVAVILAEDHYRRVMGSAIRAGQRVAEAA